MQNVTASLMETLEDGRKGFEQAAERLRKDGNTELAATFERYSQQRADFYNVLQELAADYGDSIDESGTVAGAVHRGWLTLADALTGTDPKAVLSAAEQGEDHAVKQYEEALSSDLSAKLRSVVETQAGAVRAAHDDVRSLRNKASD